MDWVPHFDWTLLTSPNELQSRLLRSLFLVLLVAVVRWTILRILNRNVDDARILYRWRKSVTYASVAIGIVLVGRIWFQGFQSLSTFLGLLSAGLAIALQDPIVNLAGWIFIVLRQPFGVGDRIQIGEHRGDVIDIRVFQFTLLEIGNWVDADQSTGRIIHIPNGKVFREAQANYTRAFEFIWNEIPVLVTFESDWRKAKSLLSEIARRHAAHLTQDAESRIRKAAQQFMIFYRHLDPIVYTNVLDSGVNLTIRYLCDPRRRRATADAIWEDVLDAFATCDDVDFAYPTYRVYRNPDEGKPGTKGTSVEPSEP